MCQCEGVLHRFDVLRDARSNRLAGREIASSPRTGGSHLYLRHPGLSVHLYLRYWRRQDRLAQAMTKQFLSIADIKKSSHNTCLCEPLSVQVAKLGGFYLPRVFNFSAIALNAAGMSLFFSAGTNGAVFIKESAQVWTGWSLPFIDKLPAFSNIYLL